MSVRDENYLCGCGGVYRPQGVDEASGLGFSHCDICGRFALECPVCRNPRTIFVRNFERCQICEDNFAGLADIFKLLIVQENH